MLTTTHIPFPPQSFMFMGETEEKAIANGDVLLRTVTGQFDTAGLVLDIGCGYGRLAYALHRAGFAGQYVGLDVKADLMTWLTQNFTATDAAYRFLAMDVQNDRYNPNGAERGAGFTIPPLPRAPSLVLLLSVFTHMHEDDVRRYLLEVARVADQNTLVYCTFFLLNPEQAQLEIEGKSSRPFPHRVNDHCRQHSLEEPLYAIAYDEQWVDRLIGECGLRIQEKRHGAWSGRKAPAGQDVLLLRKA